jgi:hypothetical protein
MRSKFFMLAAVAMLAASMPAQAVLTLEFWSGVQTFTPQGVGPASLSGLRVWNLSSPAGQAPLASLNIGAGTTQYIIRAVLRDTDNSIAQDGSGFTISQDPDADPNAGTANTNSRGLINYAARFTSTAPGVLAGTPDASQNGTATTLTIWKGGAVAASTGENETYAINDPTGPGFFTFGSVPLGLDPINNNAIVGGHSSFNPSSNAVLYPLANILLTVNGPGAGTLQLSKPTTPPPTFGTTWTDGVTTFATSLDSAVWGPGGTNVYSIPFTVVPEPSSMILAGLAVTGLGVRLRRKFRRETTTA